MLPARARHTSCQVYRNKPKGCDLALQINHSISQSINQHWTTPSQRASIPLHTSAAPTPSRLYLWRQNIGGAIHTHHAGSTPFIQSCHKMEQSQEQMSARSSSSRSLTKCLVVYLLVLFCFVFTTFLSYRFYFLDFFLSCLFNHYLLDYCASSVQQAFLDSTPLILHNRNSDLNVQILVVSIKLGIKVKMNNELMISAPLEEWVK